MGYRQSGDSRRGRFDVNFEGFAKTTTNEVGAYRFRTITPVSYPGRAPHIHFKVKAPNRQEFTSQLYLADPSQNKADFLFNRLQGHRAREGASVRQIPAPELDPNALKGSFDIVLG
jgi:protocatechuate 3,4-dioxygenase beta subunit